MNMSPKNVFAHDTEHQPIAIDLDKLIGDGLCIQANAGGGKSGAVRRLMETTYGGPQHIILDVEDEFYTLREKFDYLLAGGEGGDCPANLDNARILCRTILETGFSTIIQINTLPLLERREFIRLFLESLIDAPRSLWHPALIVLDETERYAPQREESSCLAAVVSVPDMGRKRGFTPIFSTKRLAKINKDATASINNWLIGRVAQSIDRVAAADALGFAPKSPEGRGLLQLQNRQFWGFGPAITLQPTMMRIADIVTTSVRPGTAHVPTPPTPARMKSILAKLDVETKKASEEDPGKLRATIAELRKQISEKSNAPVIDNQAIAKAKADGIAEGFESLRAVTQNDLDAVVAQLGKLVEHATDIHRDVIAVKSNIGAVATLAKPTVPVAERKTPRPSKPLGNGAGSTPAGDTKKLPAMQRILSALGQMAAMGVTEAPKALIVFLADYTNERSTGFAEALGELRTLNWVEVASPGTLRLTQAGWANTTTVSPMTNAQIHAWVVEKLGDVPGRMLQIVLESHPQNIAVDRLCTLLNYTNVRSTGFAEALSRLKEIGFIEPSAPGRVIAGAVLFVGE